MHNAAELFHLVAKPFEFFLRHAVMLRVARLRELPYRSAAQRRTNRLDRWHRPTTAKTRFYPCIFRGVHRWIAPLSHLSCDWRSEPYVPCSVFAGFDGSGTCKSGLSWLCRHWITSHWCE